MICLSYTCGFLEAPEKYGTDLAVNFAVKEYHEGGRVHKEYCCRFGNTVIVYHREVGKVSIEGVTIALRLSEVVR